MERSDTGSDPEPLHAAMAACSGQGRVCRRAPPLRCGVGRDTCLGRRRRSGDGCSRERVGLRRHAPETTGVVARQTGRGPYAARAGGTAGQWARCLYQSWSCPFPGDQTRSLRAIQIRPSDPQAVRGVLLSFDESGSLRQTDGWKQGIAGMELPDRRNARRGWVDLLVAGIAGAEACEQERAGR